MSPNRRQPACLTFQGWVVRHLSISVYARLCVEMNDGRWVETGPLLQLSIPTKALLQDDISTAANDAWKTAHLEGELDQIGRMETEVPLF